MYLVTSILTEAPSNLARVVVPVDRHTLSKRRWRVSAEDGADLAIALEAPCSHGDLLWATADKVYQVEQVPESVFEIPIPEHAVEAAKLGWFLGNQHLPVEVGADFLRLEANPHLGALLQRNKIAFSESVAVFNPPPHSGGHSHTHAHSHNYVHLPPNP